MGDEERERGYAGYVVYVMRGIVGCVVRGCEALGGKD